MFPVAGGLYDDGELTALGAALGATFVVELRHHADCCTVGVLRDRPPRLRFPGFMTSFWSVAGRLGSPEHPSKPAWHPYFAAPLLLLAVRHSHGSFRRHDPKLSHPRVASGPTVGSTAGGRRVAGLLNAARLGAFDDPERVAVRIAEREHRRHALPHPDELRVGVDAAPQKGGVVGLGVGRREADLGSRRARRPARDEGDRGLGAGWSDFDPAAAVAERAVDAGLEAELVPERQSGILVGDRTASRRCFAKRPSSARPRPRREGARAKRLRWPDRRPCPRTWRGSASRRSPSRSGRTSAWWRCAHAAGRPGASARAGPRPRTRRRERRPRC
jgi:hypothetical protein